MDIVLKIWNAFNESISLCKMCCSTALAAYKLVEGNIYVIDDYMMGPT